MTYALSSQQPPQPAEFSLSIDADLIDAMNRWRRDQMPVLSPNDAILALIRRALTESGYYRGPARGRELTDPKFDALVAMFREAAERTSP